MRKSIQLRTQMRGRLHSSFALPPNFAMVKTPQRRSKANAHALILGVYIAAMFLSALLLFGVQPLFTRMVLPRLGGSPSVWSVAMVFFQSMLLAGYAYAHVLMSLRNRYAPIVIHLDASARGCIDPAARNSHGLGHPACHRRCTILAARIVRRLYRSAILCARREQSVIASMVRSDRATATRTIPYFLYAASNVGSFIALLSYPVLFEPVFTLHAQNSLWSIGFRC